MTYEQALQLKEAKFPQKKEGKHLTRKGETVYLPTILELIEETKVNFMSRSNENKWWIGNGIKKIDNEESLENGLVRLYIETDSKIKKVKNGV